MRRLFWVLFTVSMAVGPVGGGVAQGQGMLTSEPHLAIPDDGGGPACVDTITFTQTGDFIGAFRVGLAIEHPHQAQLRVLLLPPGQVWPSPTYSATTIPAAVSAGAIELVANAGDDSEDIGYGWSQPYSYTSLTTPGDMLFDPTMSLSSVDTASGTGLPGMWLAHDASALAGVYGGDPADLGGHGGTWTLVVIDDTATGDGTLVAWQIEYDSNAGAPPEILVLRSGPIADGGADDLGALTVGDATQVTYTIGNTGLGLLHVTEVSAASAMNCTVTVLPALPFTVDPSDASGLELEITPLAEGPFAFDLHIASDDADENPYRIHVSGTATPDATEPTGTPELTVVGQSSFYTQQVGQFDVAGWSVQNTGDADLVITGVDTIGAHASFFAVSGLQLPTTLAPGASANLQVIYAPGSMWDHAAAIRFTSNHEGTPGTTSEVTVTGYVTGEMGPGDPGCQCRGSGAGTPGAGLGLLLVLGLLLWRRRRF